MESTQTDVAIIGAGLTGLALAYQLSGKVPFVVLEKEDRVGGVIQTHQKDGFLYELGPNSGTVANLETAELLEELDGAIYANEQAKKRYILKKGHWHALPSGLVSAIRTPLFKLSDKFRVLGEPFRKKGTDPDETVAHFVQRRLGRSFLDYAIDPFISGVYAGDPEALVLRHAFPLMYQMEQERGSLIKAAMARQKQRKRSNQPTPSRKIFSFEGGLSELVEGLYQKSGLDNYQLNATIQSIEPTETGFQIVYEQKEITRLLNVAKVISTVPSFVLKSLLQFVELDKLQAIDKLEYAPVVQIAVGFQNWKGRPLDGFGGLVPTKEHRSILGILFMSAIFPSRAPEDGALLNVFLGGTKGPEKLQWTDDKVRETLGRELRELLEVSEFNPELFEIKRYKAAIPQYTHVMDEVLAAVSDIESKYPELHLAGQIRNGIGIPNRIKQARQLAQRILA